MKKIFLTLAFATLCVVATGQTKQQWDRLDSLVREGFFSTARSEVERVWLQAQTRDNDSDRLLATFYLTAIDYAYEKYSAATDSAIARYTRLTRTLKGADRAVAYAFLFQTYDKVYTNQFWSYRRNAPSDDPALNYNLWHRQRMEDTLMVCVDSIVAQTDLLRGTAPDAYRRLFRCDSLTAPPIDSSLLGILVQTLMSKSEPEPYIEERRPFRTRVLERVAGLYPEGSDDVALWLDLRRLDLREKVALATYDSLCNHYRPLALGDEMRALLAFRRAEALSDDWQKVTAEQLCLETERLYPKTYGARCCRSLRGEICRPEFGIRYSTTESSRQSRLAVIKATNTPLLHMRLVRRDSLKDDWNDWTSDTLLQLAAVAEWDQPLPDSGDHLPHRYLVPLPAVEQGDYYLVAHTDSALCYDHFQSADALFITYHMPSAAGKMTYLSSSSGYLVDRQTGMPLARKKVTLHGETIVSERPRRRTCRTDKEGFFHFPVSSARYHFVNYNQLSANVDGYELFLGGDTWGPVWTDHSYENYSHEPHRLDIVMTDRPVYRLGDTVQFCCVAYYRSEKGSEWRQKVSPARNLDLTATFSRIGDDCDTLLLTTDRYGRCWGSFVVPADGQNGNYYLRIRSDNGDYFDSRSIDVEAYKPPLFAVTLSSVKEGVDTVAVCRMGQPVTIYGMAASFSGAPMTGARVEWEVSRERMLSPFQRNWVDENLFRDSLTVNDDGSFQFTFTPTPDDDDTAHHSSLTTPHSYIFTANVEVTDANGEVRESRLSLRVSSADGYCMLTSLGPSLSFVYNNFDHQPLSGNVHVSVQQLRQPDTLRVLDQRMMAEYPDARWVGDEAQFRRLFPHLAFSPDEADPRCWPVVATHLDTLTRERSLPLEGLPSGMYRIRFSLPDGTGCDTVVNYVAPGGRVTGNSLIWSRATPRPEYYNNLTCRLGDTVRIEMGSPYPHQPLYYRVAHAGKTFLHGIIILDSCKPSTLAVPVTDATRNGFVISLSAVRDGRAFLREYNVEVQRPELFCNITTETFRDRLQPGEHEQWRFRITDADSLPVPASICMTMYDKSLEQYHSFGSGFWPWDRYIDDMRTFIDLPETAHGYYRTSGFSVNNLFVGYEPQIGFSLWKLDNWYKQIAMRYGPGVLMGTITDAKTRETLPFVNLVLKWGGKQLQEATTDFDGHYLFKSLPKGNYDLEISTVGYNRYIRKVTIDGSGMKICDIALTSGACNLEEVVIEVDRVPIIELGAPETGQRISAEDIQRMPGNTVEAIVAAVGGMGYSEGDISLTQSPLTPHSSLPTPHAPLRTNLSTLAFFKPAWSSGKDGLVTVDFTMPDALTQWQMTAFAWTDDFTVGSLNRTVQTQKELMVQPLMPRFLRLGDTVELRAKVSNLTDSSLTAHVSFELGEEAGNASSLTIAPHTSGIASFRFPVLEGEGTGMRPYKVVARSAHHSDGESGLLPVLSDKERITTSRLLYIAGSPDGSEIRRTYSIPLASRQEGDSLSVSFTASPIDYVFEALPHFKRHRMPGSIYQANSAFVDHLRSQDPNATEKERTRASAQAKSQLYKLLSSQRSEGGWSWMPKGREASRYVTEVVLQRIAASPSMVDIYRRYYTQAIGYLDRQLVEQYQRDSVQTFHETSLPLSTLYTRSLWMDVKPLDKCDSLTQQAYAYYLQQSRMRALQPDLDLRSQGYLALLFQRMGDTVEAVRLATRIRERAHVADTLGMYWADNNSGLGWYQRPVENAALMVDVMAEVLKDWDAVSRIQQWILSCRQGTTWNTDMSTAAALGALLCAPESGERRVESGEQRGDVSLTVNGLPIETFHETSLPLNIELRSTSPYPAWGAVFYSHDTPLDSIRTEGTGITLRRTLSRVAPDGSLTLLRPDAPLHVGEKVRVHIDIYCERDLDRMVLRDQRAAGHEPVSTASGWRYNDGLHYYVDMRDEQADCYIDRLNEGHYFVEYDLWVRHAGSFATGISTLQSVYAPEFRACTGSERLLMLK